MSILSSHADSWHSDKWYRRAWYIWPQAISLLLIGWLFVGVLLKPMPWAAPQTQTPPAPKPAPQRQPDPQPDETICSRSNSHDALNACTRLIDGGRPRFYFNRAQIYFRNGDYDRAIADLSAFIRLNPNDVRALNDRGLSYERKGEYDRAIDDYSEVIRLDKVWKTPNASGGYSNRGSAYEKKGERDKALADFREAQNNGSTTAPEDINRLERAIESLRKKYVVNGLDGLSLGGRVSPQSNEYQKYQCTPSDL